MTMTEIALGQMLEHYGRGDLPDVDVAALLERCDRADRRRRELGKRALVDVDPTSLRTLIDLALTAKALTALRLPPGLVMTQQYFALLSVLDKIRLAPPPAPAAAAFSDCTHDTLRRMHHPGLECVKCHRWVSDRQIFEAEVAPGGYIDDTSSPEQMVEKRAALVRRMLDDPELARMP
jgi:hypothetical protein